MVKTIYSLIYIKIYDTTYKSAMASPGGDRGNVPPKPGKFVKDGEQPAPQPAVNLESNKKFKFLLTF